MPLRLFKMHPESFMGQQAGMKNGHFSVLRTLDKQVRNWRILLNP